MPDQMPGDEGPCDAAVAVGEGVDLSEPVVEPGGYWQGVALDRLPATSSPQFCP